MKIQPLPLQAGADPVAFDKLTRLLSGLRPGAELDVEVVGRGRDDLTIRLGGMALRARSTESLKPGQTVQVRVLSPWPDLLLKLISSSATEGQDVHRLLWKGLPLMQPETLRALWMDIARELRWLGGANAQGQDWTTFLRGLALQAGRFDLLSYLQQSGLMLEKKLASRALGREHRRALWPDLKALVLRTLQGSNRPLQAMGGLYDLLQGSQSLSLFSRAEEPQLYLPLVLWGWQSGEWGDLTVFRDGRRQAGKGSWWVRLRLELGDLGRLLVEILFQANVFQCRFRASNPGTQRAIDAALPELESYLAGMNLGSVRCECGMLEDGSQEWSRCPGVIPEGLFETMA